MTLEEKLLAWSANPDTGASQASNAWGFDNTMEIVADRLENGTTEEKQEIQDAIDVQTAWDDRATDTDTGKIYWAWLRHPATIAVAPCGHDWADQTFLEKNVDFWHYRCEKSHS